MSIAVLLLCFAAATYATWTRGVSAAFALVYLPVLLLLSAVPEFDLPLLPNLKSTYAVGYGVLVGLALRGGEFIPIKWNALDTLIVAIWLCAVASTGQTQGAAMARNVLGDWFFDFITPYFLARIAFHSADGRRLALGSTIACAFLIAFLAAVEMRLYPNWASEKLEAIGLYTVPNSMALYRFGLNRARATFHQPMDEGNCGMLMAALIAIFASTTAIGLRNVWVLAGIAASMFISAASLSFSAFANIFGAVGLVAMTRWLPWTGRWLAVVAVVGILGGVYLTNDLLERKLGERPEQLGQNIDDSMYTRTFIVQQSWPVAKEAGWFGFGKDLTRNKLDLSSVDNAYLLFIMQRGWLFFALFLLIPFVVTFRAAGVWRDTFSPVQRLPVAVGVSVILTVMGVMYTLFFGFVYATLWLILLGIFNSVCDTLQRRVRVEPTVIAPREQRLAIAAARGA